jgi:alpha-methylacyl-CoA racemase
VQPAPAPRFSRSSPELTLPPAHAGQHTREILSAWGVSDDRIGELIDSGAVKQAG